MNCLINNLIAHPGTDEGLNPNSVHVHNSTSYVLSTWLLTLKFADSNEVLTILSSLQVLHLENSILSGRPLMILVTAIKMNEILRELYLADNKLMPSDGIQLGNMLKFNHRLTLLDVRNNHLQVRVK